MQIILDPLNRAALCSFVSFTFFEEQRRIFELNRDIEISSVDFLEEGFFLSLSVWFRFVSFRTGIAASTVI